MSEEPEIQTTTMKVPITPDNFPQGNWWEADGSCWRAVLCKPTKWRWRPMNAKALAKDGPEGEMTDFVQPLNFKSVSPS